MKPIRWRDLFEARSDFRRTWPQLLLTDLLSRAIVIVALTPMVGLLISVFLRQTDYGVLSDTEIAAFLLHPIGITALLIVSAVSLGIFFAKQGVLMVIGFGAVENRRITWLDAMRYIGRYSFELVRLAGHISIRLLLITTPFLLGIGGVYLLLLNKHDINFYLADKPPEFFWAIAACGLLALGMAFIILKKCADWVLAMPLVLFEGKRARQALLKSSQTAAVYGWEIPLRLALWFGAIALLSGCFTMIVSLAGKVLVPDIGGNFTVMAVGIGVTLMLTGLGNFVIAVISTMLLPLLIVRLYRSLAGPGRIDPDPAAPGSLGKTASFQIPGKAILGVSAAVLALIILGGYALSRNMGEEAAVEIIAHRGASAAAPENTMAAFRRAILDKADWIELDVQENGDNEVVVAHDSDFMKVARNDLKIWDASNEALRDIDIGSWYAPEYANERVPTLRQALELAKDKIGIVIELKYYGHDRNIESRVVDIVEQTRMEADIMIMSLNMNGLLKAVSLRPTWPHGLLNTASVGDLTRLGLDFLALNAVAATPAMIRRAHEQGMKIYVWTVNDPVQMSVMMSRGVDGIITDDPALARQVIKLRRQLSPFGRLVVWIAGESGLLHGVDNYATEENA